MRAISSMATRGVLTELLAAAAEAGVGSGAGSDAGAVELESVGGVDAEQRVAAGERFDLVFLASGALKRLAEGGHVDAGSVAPLVLSQVAVAVASGSSEPAALPAGRVSGGAGGAAGGEEAAGGAGAAVASAFADADGVRAALRAARRIGYSTGPSGTALVRMIDEWGMTAEVGDRLVQARPGIPVARSLAEGDVDLGFQQLSELVGQPGVRILGVMPADCAIDTVFAGAVSAVAADPAAAAAVLRFLSSPAAAPIVRAHHFELPPAAGR